eukprot:12213683-Alexandrium_andersonii.AAC.1
MWRSAHIARGGCASGASRESLSKGTLLSPERAPTVARGSGPAERPASCAGEGRSGACANSPRTCET